jgi:hypothetical protein
MADPHANGDKSQYVDEESRREIQEAAPDDGNLTRYAPGEQATYDPGDTEVTRGRVQGLGMSQRDMSVQHDPTGSATAREFRDRTGTAATDDGSPHPVESDNRSGG